MASVQVQWDDPNFEIGRGIQADRHSQLFGELTTDHESAREGQPVLVEDITRRVYLPTELPPKTELRLVTEATELPEVARQAQRVGYPVVKPS
jgi:hypothetical protein